MEDLAAAELLPFRFPVSNGLLSRRLVRISLGLFAKLKTSGSSSFLSAGAGSGLSISGDLGETGADSEDLKFSKLNEVRGPDEDAAVTGGADNILAAKGCGVPGVLNESCFDGSFEDFGISVSADEELSRWEPDDVDLTDGDRNAVF